METNETILKGGYIYSNRPVLQSWEATAPTYCRVNTLFIDRRICMMHAGRWFYFAPAEGDSHEARDRSHGSPKDDLGCGALRYGREVPYGPDRFSPKAAVNGQANAARSDRVDGYVEELHPHGVENFQGKQRPCWNKPGEHRTLIIGLRKRTRRTRGINRPAIRYHDALLIIYNSDM